MPVRARIEDAGLALLYDHTVNAASGYGCGPFGGSPAGRLPPRFVPFENVLHVESVGPATFVVAYVVPAAAAKAEVESVEIQTETPDTTAESLLARAYAEPTRALRTLVLVNPHGGQGKAAALFHEQVAPVFDAARLPYSVQTTTHKGHAEEIVRELDLALVDLVVCALGDGIPHEVFNGMYARADRDAAFATLAVAQLPCGSGNAMCCSTMGTGSGLTPGVAAWRLLKSTRGLLDLMAVSQPDRPTRLSFLSTTYGIIAACDLKTEWLRFLGPVRFDLGVVAQVVAGSKYSCDLSVDYVAKGKGEVEDVHSPETVVAARKSPFELHSPGVLEPVPASWSTVAHGFTSHLGIFYAGNMPYVSPGVAFFPRALPNDGTMDIFLTDSRTRFSTMVGMLTQVDTAQHVHYAEAEYSKVRAFRLTPHTDSVISVDGEEYPCTVLQGEVLPGVASTLFYNGEYSKANLHKT